MENIRLQGTNDIKRISKHIKQKQTDNAMTKKRKTVKRQTPVHKI